MSALICETITTWVEEEILEPVDTWVTEVHQNCKELPWWNPLRWFCWLVVKLVKVVIWVIKTIEVAIFETICTVVAFLVGWIINIIAIVIDSIFQTNMSAWVVHWFFPRFKKCKYISSKESITLTGGYDYIFECNCKGKKIQINVSAYTDEEAKDKAKKQC